MKKIEAEVDATWRDFFVGLLYSGWPGRPSSGAVVVLHWCVIFVLRVVWWPEMGGGG